MASPLRQGSAAPTGTIWSWLDTPISGLSCLFGWCAATVVFVGVINALGGLGLNDTFESVFSTWATAHGQLRCAFPPGYRSTIAPLYPLLSGVVAAMGRIGHTVPFPSRPAMGPRCDTAFSVINTWSLKAGTTASTVKIGYLSWLALMGGVIAVLRAVRSRSLPLGAGDPRGRRLPPSRLAEPRGHVPPRGPHGTRFCAWRPLPVRCAAGGSPRAC